MNMNTNQRKVLRELLKPGCSTIAEVAKKVGLSERTIYGYLQDDQFTQALNQGLDRSITQASLQLAHLSELAVSCYREILEDPNTSDTNKRLTADSVLTHLIKLQTEKQFNDRLERLERMILE